MSGTGELRAFSMEYLDARGQTAPQVMKTVQVSRCDEAG